MKKVMIMDVDGTITDFKNIDKNIIFEIFKNNRIVLAFDYLLWKINSLDYISNKFWIFKIRMWIYSLLSNRKYNDCMVEYKKKYVQKSKSHFENFLIQNMSILEKSNIEVIFLSHDRFDHEMDHRIISVNQKFKYVLYNIYGKYDNIYIIGNNYMDDIKLGMRLENRIKKEKKKIHIKTIYIGNSFFLKKHILCKKNIFSYNSISEFIENIKKGVI